MVLSSYGSLSHYETQLLHPLRFHFSIPIVPFITSLLSLEICNLCAESWGGGLAATETPARAQPLYLAGSPTEQ